MTHPPDTPMLRAERALQLIPEIEALTPLRALLFASARAPAAGTERLRALGKRTIDPAMLRSQLPEMLEAVNQHVAALSTAVIDALECEQRADKPGAVRCLLRGGERERDAGRASQARIWFELALGLAEELRERRPEIEALQDLADLCGTMASHDEAARWHQRSLALAEAEYENAAAIRACLGLGRIALARDVLGGAEAWYRRGLALAGDDAGPQRGQLHHHMAILAIRRHDLTHARTHLAHARAFIVESGDARAMAGVCRTEAAVARADRDEAGAEGALRDALQWVALARDAPRLGLSIGIELADVLIAQGRYLDADDELRRREDEAIRHYFPRGLARVYALLGRLRGLEGEEDGFVFFEIAIELCGAGQLAPLVEADVFTEYGAFRRRLGQMSEARAYLERAQELLRPLGDRRREALVATELERLGPGGAGIEAAKRSSD